MRLWSLSPVYLDTHGLLALWREALLAREVLKGNTRGYRNHPQLIRFRQSPAPLAAIDSFLHYIYEESLRRNFQFDRSKLAGTAAIVPQIAVTHGQIMYELHHLLVKLHKRSPEHYAALRNTSNILLHPLFYSIDGDVASWEKQKT